MGDATGLCMVVYGCKAEHGVGNRSPGRAQAHADHANTFDIEDRVSLSRHVTGPNVSPDEPPNQ